MLRWKKISKEEKLKCMDKMLSYIRHRTQERGIPLYDRDVPTDVYSLCKTVAVNDLFGLIADHVEEVED